MVSELLLIYVQNLMKAVFMFHRSMYKMHVGTYMFVNSVYICQKNETNLYYYTVSQDLMSSTDTYAVQK